ncbi:hypothetical protein KFE25_009561 [Diacronema lutheri]|uniref:RRM domain-containing protein n=1 Tax=Diacronema lutheri TaxID=2081491 RepID=A0A8J6CI99_DIALT|nr:hypothetical protein KFE25_009561 [Diacronema lutheri]
MAARGGAAVFVGNIPFDASEEELQAHLAQVGPVVALRVVTDPETGRLKGYGFCEYRNTETALSAARNLHELEFNGRPLRVSLTDGVAQQVAGGGAPSNLVDAPRHAMLAQTQISQVVLAMTPEQLADLLMSARTYVGQEPHHAHELLSKCPPLAHALVQALNRVNAILSLQSPQQQAAASGQPVGAFPQVRSGQHDGRQYLE